VIILRRLAAGAAIALAAFISVGASAPPSAWADGGAAATATAPASAGTPGDGATDGTTVNSDGTTVNSDGIPVAPTDPPKVELVLDVSGSMAAKDLGGMTRIAAAQSAFDQVVDALPDDDQVGVRVLGASYPGTSKTVGCADTQQIVPVGQLNRDDIKTAVAALRPTGWTPIGLALQDAAKDLGNDASSRRIVLISDGEDDCAPPNPCDVARSLAAQGTHLVVDTLGLTLDDGVRRQLSCISQATGGTYTAVTSESQLSHRLTQLVQRATAETVPPAAVSGASSCASAPLLTPGVYSDREDAQADRWYRVTLAPDQELRASASVAIDRAVDPHYAVTLDATGPDGSPLAAGSGTGAGRTDLVSAGLRWSTGGSAGRTVCLDVANAFSGAASAKGQPGFPVQLTVDVVQAAPAPSTRAQGLGAGWLFLGVLAGVGLITGLILGWLGRWRIAIWRTP